MRKSSGEDFYCEKEIFQELMDKLIADPNSLTNKPPPGVRSIDELPHDGPSLSLPPADSVRKRDFFGQAILITILELGGSANLQEIAQETNCSPDDVFDWIYNNKGRVKGLKKLSPGRYAFKPRKNARLPTDLVSDYTDAFLKAQRLKEFKKNEVSD